MRRYGPYLALFLLIAVNALVLAGVWSNRSETPDASVELTERELILERADKENSGVSLRLDWRQYGEQDVKWFDRDKLTAVGFDCSAPVGTDEAELRYRKALPRKTFVVLEFEGKAWEAWQALGKKMLADVEAKIARGEAAANDLAKERKRFARDLLTASRLFPVDVGNDPQRLRVRYPDRGRFIITPARVRLHYNAAMLKKGKVTEPARLSGAIAEVLTETVRVPRDKQALFRALEKKDEFRRPNYFSYDTDEKPVPPRYRVLLNYGRRHEPWVAAVRP